MIKKAVEIRSSRELVEAGQSVTLTASLLRFSNPEKVGFQWFSSTDGTDWTQIKRLPQNSKNPKLRTKIEQTTWFKVVASGSGEPREGVIKIEVADQDQTTMDEPEESSDIPNDGLLGLRENADVDEVPLEMQLLWNRRSGKYELLVFDVFEPDSLGQAVLMFSGESVARLLVSREYIKQGSKLVFSFAPPNINTEAQVVIYYSNGRIGKTEVGTIPSRVVSDSPEDQDTPQKPDLTGELPINDAVVVGVEAVPSSKKLRVSADGIPESSKWFWQYRTLGEQGYSKWQFIQNSDGKTSSVSPSRSDTEVRVVVFDLATQAFSTSEPVGLWVEEVTEPKEVPLEAVQDEAEFPINVDMDRLSDDRIRVVITANESVTTYWTQWHNSALDAPEWIDVFGSTDQKEVILPAGVNLIRVLYVCDGESGNTGPLVRPDKRVDISAFGDQDGQPSEVQIVDDAADSEAVTQEGEAVEASDADLPEVDEVRDAIRGDGTDQSEDDQESGEGVDPADTSSDAGVSEGNGIVAWSGRWLSKLWGAVAGFLWRILLYGFAALILVTIGGVIFILLHSDTDNVTVFPTPVPAVQAAESGSTSENKPPPTLVPTNTLTPPPTMTPSFTPTPTSTPSPTMTLTFTPTPTPPIVSYFRLSNPNDLVVPGSQALVAWDVQNAASVKIHQVGEPKMDAEVLVTWDLGSVDTGTFPVTVPQDAEAIYLLLVAEGPGGEASSFFVLFEQNSMSISTSVPAVATQVAPVAQPTQPPIEVVLCSVTTTKFVYPTSEIGGNTPLVEIAPAKLVDVVGLHNHNGQAFYSIEIQGFPWLVGADQTLEYGYAPVSAFDRDNNCPELSSS